MKSIIDSLNWRYATKKFDTTKKLTTEQVDMLLEAARLAPTSAGLQPLKIVHVSDPMLREQVKAAGYGQPQMTDASDLFVFAVNKNVDIAYVDNYMNKLAAERGIDVSVLEGFSNMVKGNVASKTPEQIVEWSARQAYIAVGIMLTAAAVNEIDACPMEGFDPNALDKVLGLDTIGAHSLVVVAAGYRAADDATASYKKFRFPKNEIVIEK